MISRINLSTGPVAVSANVSQALAGPPISHRSEAFRDLYKKTTDTLCDLFNVRKTYLLTGSGTLANECMLQEIKQLNEPGLILSNGEFGFRLIQQAARNNISYFKHELEWGEIFDADVINILIQEHKLKWILCCHCETSTGVINDLEKIMALCKSHRILCFIDCMSSVGTTPLDLSGVTMATASSGKGLASIPGLGIVFSNSHATIKKAASVYLDLAHYDLANGIPFTISSNLVKALYVSILQKLKASQFDLLQDYGEKIYRTLHRYELIPFSESHSKVFTIVTDESSRNISVGMKCPLKLSYESDYLKRRGWQQLAMFGYYTKEELAYVVDYLGSSKFMSEL